MSSSTPTKINAKNKQWNSLAPLRQDFATLNPRNGLLVVKDAVSKGVVARESFNSRDTHTNTYTYREYVLVDKFQNMVYDMVCSVLIQIKMSSWNKRWPTSQDTKWRFIQSPEAKHAINPGDCYSRQASLFGVVYLCIFLNLPGTRWYPTKFNSGQRLENQGGVP